MNRMAWILVRVAFAAGLVGLARNTYYNGHDFEVMWKAARYFVSGEAPYSIPRDGGMVFKYPPWSLPFFVPFAALPLGPAKALFGIAQAAALVSVVLWTRVKLRISSARMALLVAAFWGLWMVHTLDGQVALLMLGVALWAWRPELLSRLSLRGVAVCFALSLKIFTLLPVLGELRGRRSVSVLLGCCALGAALSLPVASAQKVSFPSGVLAAWKEASTSGASQLGPGKTRDRSNAGLSAYLLREARVPLDSEGWDVRVSILLTLLGGLCWWKVSRRLDPRIQWVGWLGLVPVVHPLPWWHLFVFAFPAASLALEMGWRRRGWALFASGSGVFLLTAATEKVLGDFGVFLELHAAKSWGTLLCLAVIALNPRTGGGSSDDPALLES